MNKSILKISCSILLALTMVACTEEDYGDVNTTRISKSDLDPSFIIKEVSANHYLLEGNVKNVIISEWNLDDGAGYNKINTEDTLFLPDAGTYTIRHYVSGAGGVTSDTISQSLTVATSDLNYGNLIKGGKFASAEDISKWTIGGTGSSDGIWTFTDDKATIKAYSYGGRGIYQPIEVEAGKTYKIDMVISSESGVSDSWFEVYCGYSVPTTTGDYSEGGKIYSLNTWNSSTGTTKFSGKFSKLSLGNAEDNKGTFTATTTGTVYLVLRGGGNDMKDGLSITNVEFRGM